jgi:Zn-dependent peptidase ImmA (M78 family)/transcriptional regulator with XRE-family HTH domain
MPNIISFPDRARGFVRERLVEARQAMQLSRAELAREVGITGQAIGYYESGERKPDMDLLLKIAAVLKQPVTFFLHQSMPLDQAANARFFRSVGPKSNKTNLALDVRSKWLWEIVQFVVRHVPLPKPNIPSLADPMSPDGYTLEEIEQIATATRRAWGLGDGPIANMTALLETNGFILSRLEIGSQKIDSFSCWIDGRPYIFLGSDKGSYARSRFDAAHELFHLLRHSDVSQEDLERKRVRDRIEREANWFAGAFLVPRSSLLSEFYSTRSSHLLGLKRRWGASMQAIAHRSRDIGAIGESDYIAFRKQMSAKGQLSKEPLDDTPLEQPTLLFKAWKILIEKNIIRDNGLEDNLGFSLEMVAQFCEAISRLPPAAANSDVGRLTTVNQNET